MKHIVAALALVIVMATFVCATNSLFWRSSWDDLNDPSTYTTLPKTGDRAVVITDDNGVTFYRYTGGQWIECRVSAAYGLKMSGVLESQNNTTALSDNMTSGDVYRTGDSLKIVH